MDFLKLRKDDETGNSLKETTSFNVMELYFDFSKGLFHIDNRSPDYDHESFTSNEFRIAGTNVEIRTIEKFFVVPPGGEKDTTYYIRDGIVLEDEIRKSRGKFFKEEDLLKQKDETEWRQIEGVPRYFALYEHPHLVDRAVFHQIIRDDMRRLISGTNEVFRRLRELGVEIEEGEPESDNFRFPRGDAAISQLQFFFAEEFRKYGVTESEWRMRPLHLSLLKFWQKLD